MKRKFFNIFMLLAILASASTLQARKAFGSQEDADFANSIWERIDKAKLANTKTKLQEGSMAHAEVREIFETKIDNKRVIINRSYSAKDLSVEEVEKNREKYLTSYFVMIKKENYDKRHKDWFWAKFDKFGELEHIPNAGVIAGRFPGCIGCHRSAQGKDYVFRIKDNMTFVDLLKK